MSQDSISGMFFKQDSFKDAWGNMEMTGPAPDSFTLITTDPNDEYNRLMSTDNFAEGLFRCFDEECMGEVGMFLKQEQEDEVSCDQIPDDGGHNGGGLQADHEMQPLISNYRSEHSAGASHFNTVLPDSTQSNMIPSHTNYPGSYEFSIIFQEQPEKLTKSTSYTYSERLDKLFINMGTNCIVCFGVKDLPPDGCVIRALPIFEKAEHVSEVVKRCPTHALPADVSNLGHKSPIHLVRCDNDLAIYNEDPRSGRFSVTIPFVPPQAGTEHTRYLYKFMCFGSCIGGLNRRPLMLIFTLEKNGKVLGRRALRVRICACPGRDRKNEEKPLKKEIGVNSKRNIALLDTAQTSTSSVVPNVPMQKRTKTSEQSDDEEFYIIKVTSKAHYKLLSSIKTSLELADTVPQEVKEQYFRDQEIDKLKSSELLELQAARCMPSSSATFNHRTARMGFPPPIALSAEAATSPALVRGQSIGKSNQPGTSTGRKPFLSKSKRDVQVKRESFHTISECLESIGMSAYVDKFNEKNLILMSQLNDFSEQEMRKLRIGDAHHNAIWKALLKCRDFPNR